jgi:hypothetical protein
MFGYINPQRSHLFIKDEQLYKALYCGMCKSIGKGCGAIAKTALTYDMAFMSALLHNIKNDDVKVKKCRCALHPIKRRFMATPDETSIILGCINTVLAYYKLLDDKQDGDKKGIFAFLYRAGYKRTLKKHKKVADIIALQMDNQRILEETNSSIVEEASTPTAQMMAELSDYVLEDCATPNTHALCYAVGKWIYLADALDDYDKDVKKGRYNVLYNAYKCSTKEQLVAENGQELSFLFDSIFADLRENMAKIKFHFNHDLTDNIILMGIPTTTRRLFYGKCGQGKKENKDEERQS